MITKWSAAPTSKYDLAARVATDGLERADEYDWRRMTADEQRAVFGGYLFGRKEIQVDASGQGLIHVRWLGAWEGTHSSHVWEHVSFEQVVRAAHGDFTGWPFSPRSTFVKSRSVGSYTECLTFTQQCMYRILNEHSVEVWDICAEMGITDELDVGMVLSEFNAQINALRPSAKEVLV